MTFAAEQIRLPVAGTTQGPQWSGGRGVPEYLFTHTTTQTGVAGRNRYYTPIGVWFYDHVGEAVLERDTGGGFVVLTEGVDWVNLVRGVGNPGAGVPATVADLAIGFNLTVASVGGESYRFTWKERRIAYVCPAVGVARLDNSDNYDNTTIWNVGFTGASPVGIPNGITVPELTGYVVEFWRLTKKQGGMRHGNPAMLNGGRRYVPYFRGAVDQFRLRYSKFLAAHNDTVKWRFRVCYYNPTTGARSALSADKIVVWKNNLPEQCNTTQLRKPSVIWIE